MDRKARIEELGWNRTARVIRGALEASLAELGEFSFLPKTETMEFGASFWDEVRARGFIPPEEAPFALRELSDAIGDADVIWLHGKTNGAGAIRIAGSRLIPRLLRLSEMHGPDILFATPDLRDGLALDVGEHDERLTWWLGSKQGSPSG